jgi:DHA1 family bicyclomycin/chloramphenicol resistance-like MFS transporter
MPATMNPSARRWRAITLTALVAYGPVSTDLYLPSLPAMQQALATDIAGVQMTLTAFVWGFALAQLVYGPLSDRFGRRPVLLVGLVLFLMASLVCVAATTIEGLIAGRFLQALGACAGPVLGRAVVRDLYGPLDAGRVLAYMGTAMALIPAAAPTLGGVLEVTFGWRANFVALTLFGVMVLALTWFGLPESHYERDDTATRPARIISNFATLLRHRGFLGSTLAVSAAFAGLFSFISGSPFVLIEVLGLPPDRFGFAFLVAVVGFMGGSYLSGRLVRRLGTPRLVTVGCGLCFVGGLSMALLAFSGVISLAAVLVPCGIYFAGAGLAIPVGFAAALAPFPRMAGAASSLLGFLQMGLGGLAGMAVGHFYDGSTWPMALAMALGGSLALLACRLLRQTPVNGPDAAV